MRQIQASYLKTI